LVKSLTSLGGLGFAGISCAREANEQIMMHTTVKNRMKAVMLFFYLPK
jgi:hypothetical protein